MPYRKMPTAEYESLRPRIGNLYRNFAVQFPSTNDIGFPDVLPYDGLLPERLLPYNDVTRYAPGVPTAVHFFLSDNRFERAWSDPAVVLTRLLEVGMALGPDYSTFVDWPMAVQVFNVYRNRWCCALWQREGVPVIPTVSWSDSRSFDWVFDGLPHHSPVALSGFGCRRDPETRRRFCEGYREMVRQLEPNIVLCYGGMPKEVMELACVRTYPPKWLVPRREGLRRE